MCSFFSFIHRDGYIQLTSIKSNLLRQRRQRSQPRRSGSGRRQRRRKRRYRANSAKARLEVENRDPVREADRQVRQEGVALYQVCWDCAFLEVRYEGMLFSFLMDLVHNSGYMHGADRLGSSYTALRGALRRGVALRAAGALGGRLICIANRWVIFAGSSIRLNKRWCYVRRARGGSV